MHADSTDASATTEALDTAVEVAGLHRPACSGVKTSQSNDRPVLVNTCCGPVDATAVRQRRSGGAPLCGVSEGSQRSLPSAPGTLRRWCARARGDRHPEGHARRAAQGQVVLRTYGSQPAKKIIGIHGTHQGGQFSLPWPCLPLRGHDSSEGGGSN